MVHVGLPQLCTTVRTSFRRKEAAAPFIIDGCFHVDLNVFLAAELISPQYFATFPTFKYLC